MKKIEVLMASDDNYVQHLGVTLVSALENTRNPGVFNITVLDGGISQKNINLIAETISSYGASIVFKKLQLDNPDKYVVYGHISLTAYYRILLPQVYDKNIEKVIYLDCDVIVNHDLIDLYDVYIKDYVIGAVAETSNARMADFGHSEKPYFNSGVMLINFSQWIAQDITRKVIEYIYKNPEKLIYWDQDALNACLVDKWKPLENKWNYLREFVEINKNWKNAKTFVPFIVHYSNNTKPWHYSSRNPYDYLYFKYLALSPWKEFQPKDKTLRKIISKNVKLTLRRFNLRRKL